MGRRDEEDDADRRHARHKATESPSRGEDDEEAIRAKLRESGWKKRKSEAGSAVDAAGPDAAKDKDKTASHDGDKSSKRAEAERRSSRTPRSSRRSRSPRRRDRERDRGEREHRSSRRKPSSSRRRSASRSRSPASRSRSRSPSPGSSRHRRRRTSSSHKRRSSRSLSRGREQSSSKRSRRATKSRSRSTSPKQSTPQKAKEIAKKDEPATTKESETAPVAKKDDDGETETEEEEDAEKAKVPDDEEKPKEKKKEQAKDEKEDVNNKDEASSTRRKAASSRKSSRRSKSTSPRSPSRSSHRRRRRRNPSYSRSRSPSRSRRARRGGSRSRSRSPLRDRRPRNRDRDRDRDRRSRRGRSYSRSRSRSYSSSRRRRRAVNRSSSRDRPRRDANSSPEPHEHPPAAASAAPAAASGSAPTASGNVVNPTITQLMAQYPTMSLQEIIAKMQASNVTMAAAVAQKPARELYVGNLPPNVAGPQLQDFLGTIIQQVGLCAQPGNPIKNTWISTDGHFAFCEMRTVEECNLALLLNQLSLLGQPLKFGRPRSFMGPPQPVPQVSSRTQTALANLGCAPNPAWFAQPAVPSMMGGPMQPLGSSLPPLEMSMPPPVAVTQPAVTSHVGLTAEPLSNRLIMMNIPVVLTEDQVKELVEPFGALKSFSLVKDTTTGASMGSALFEYQDDSVAAEAVKGLNGLDIGGIPLSVQRQPGSGVAALGSLPPVKASTPAAKPEDETSDVLKMVRVLVDCCRRGLVLGIVSLTSVVRALCVFRQANMVSLDELKDDDEFADLTEDVEEECKRFGTVAAMEIPRPKVPHLPFCDIALLR
ncbi:hypothetical protein BBJ28_00002975 [Nothophytophthora sp. Chile5]|nr:hypothetical protein BBJ28_00002975 [Nothophytophthora sp. Chile5]